MLRKFLVVLSCTLTLSTSFSQSISTSDLNASFLKDEELASWKWLHQTEGWPDKAKRKEIKDGNLLLEPGTSGWFADKNAPFLYKDIRGDFDVSAAFALPD